MKQEFEKDTNFWFYKRWEKQRNYLGNSNAVTAFLFIFHNLLR